MCDRKIGIFDCCSVVQGDCLELMKQLPDGCVDAVVTDPPYGIKVNAFREQNHSKKGTTRNYGDMSWDEKFPREAIDDMRRVSRWQVIFGGNYYADWLPPSGCWLVWDKQNTGWFADCELAWTNLDKAIRRVYWMWNGMIQRGDDERVHPTQKPEGVMAWVLSQVEDAETVLDPTCGSGTTLVAAKKLGRHFLGFEISPEYCDIARKRLAAVDAQPSLFQPQPEQLSL